MQRGQFNDFVGNVNGETNEDEKSKAGFNDGTSCGFVGGNAPDNHLRGGLRRGRRKQGDGFAHLYAGREWFLRSDDDGQGCFHGALACGFSDPTGSGGGP